MVFLSRVKNESVVGQQRDGIGDEFVQLLVAEFQRRLRPPWCLLLADDIGDIVGAEGLRSRSLLDGGGDNVRAVLADQFE